MWWFQCIQINVSSSCVNFSWNKKSRAVIFSDHSSVRLTEFLFTVSQYYFYRWSSRATLTTCDYLQSIDTRNIDARLISHHVIAFSRLAGERTGRVYCFFSSSEQMDDVLLPFLFLSLSLSLFSFCFFSIDISWDNDRCHRLSFRWANGCVHFFHYSNIRR